MSIVWLGPILVLLLVLVNALLAGTEMALVNLREGQLRRLGQSGPKGAQLERLAREPNRYLSAVQLAITLSGFLASAIAAVAISEPVARVLEPLGGSAEAVALALVTVVLALFTLVVGEIVPKRVAMQRSEGWSMAMVRPLSVFITVTRPILAFLGWASDIVVRLVGADPETNRETMTHQELVDLVQAQTSLSGLQRHIMAGAVEIAGRSLRQIAVPRRDVVTVDAHGTTAEALEVLRAVNHSCAPAVGEGLDDLHGEVHVLDLVGPERPLSEVVRPILALPESLSALEALRRLHGESHRMAVVVDEFGGTEGMVTVTDVVDELVGATDLDAVESDESGPVEPTEPLVLPASTALHDLEDMGVVLPAGEYVSVGGLVLDVLGRIPQVGERIEVEGHIIEVVAVDERRVETVRVEAIPPPPETDPDDD